MRFKIDENLPEEAARLLRADGHDASTAREEGLAGSEDRSIAEICKGEERVFLTLDQDFADIRAYPPAEHAGLIVFRLSTQDKQQVLFIMGRLLELIRSEIVSGKLWIVEEGDVRVRE